MIGVVRPVASTYEFVPYKYGAFSFTSYADRRKLVARGLLADDENLWRLTDAGREMLEHTRDLLLSAFVRRYASPRGDELVAETYRRSPYYETRSEIANGPSRLTCWVREQEAGKRLDKVAIVEESSHLRGDVRPYVGRRLGDIIHNLRAAIDDGDDVFEVVTREDVIATASMKCLQLCGDEECRRNDPHGVSGDSVGLGRFDGAPIRPVAESKHAGVCWQYVDDHVTMPPAAERRAF